MRKFSPRDDVEDRRRPVRLHGTGRLYHAIGSSRMHESAGRAWMVRWSLKGARRIVHDGRSRSEERDERDDANDGHFRLLSSCKCLRREPSASVEECFRRSMSPQTGSSTKSRRRIKIEYAID